MNNLSVHVHDKQNASFKYDDNQIRINEKVWDPVLEMLLNEVEAVYFHGRLFNIVDDDFLKTVFYLCDEILFDNGDNPTHLFFRIKDAALLFNRNLLDKMWNYYEFPALVFSYDKGKEDALINAIINESYFSEIVSVVESVTILYPNNVDSDFLWITCSKDRPNLFFLKNLE